MQALAYDSGTMSKYTAKIAITFNGIEGIEVELTGSYIHGSRGYRERSGAQLEPDEPAYMEIETAKLAQDVCRFDEEANTFTNEVTHHAGDDVELTDEQQEAAQSALEASWIEFNRESIVAAAQCEEEAWRGCP